MEAFLRALGSESFLPSTAQSHAQTLGRALTPQHQRVIDGRNHPQHDIDLTTVTGTGPSGRIVRADVDAVLGRQQPPPRPPQEQSVVASPADEEVPLTAIRKITAQRLTESAAAPHFHLIAAVDAGPLLELRTALNNQVFSGDARCSVTDLLVRAVAVTLAAHREINASWGGDRVLRHGRVNVGIAVALDEGLIVPVIRDADRKGVAEIVAEARSLAERARAGRLTPDEFTGGTFTISNLGMFGIEHFTAVINPPESAILAVGAAREEPVVREGQVVIRSMMRLTLTSDHRVVDGAT
ncbi:MAG: 2-oxo acid dehydrogenase subunit E2, partial [Gemmatimonadota bacterium]|nr:2-oxo acid dehydrogenase subunit E2 [Gemmatimonadota bacterium]